MSFKQRSSPLQQGYTGVGGMLNTLMNNSPIINNGMTAAQIAYSNTPAGQVVQNNTTAPTTAVNPNDFSRPEAASNATAKFSNDSWVTKGQQSAAAIANPVIPTIPQTTGQQTTNTVNKGKNWFGNAPTNVVGNDPQSTTQGTTNGWRRMDSHNTSIFDRTNNGSMFNNSVNNAITDPSNMFSPLPQLKKEQMEYNKISPKAFSNAGTIGKMMGQSIPNSPFMQMVDPLTGNQIDPTMSQDPNAPVPPPTGVQVPITPTYDINQ
jgi:hypothetical protein